MQYTSPNRLMFQVPADALRAVYQAVAAEVGPRAAAQVMRLAGSRSGSSFHAAFESRLHEAEPASDTASVDAQRFWELLADFFEDLGWGGLRFEPLHAGVVSLSSGDWKEARPGSAQQPTCHFTTGLLSDLLGRVGAADLAVLEVECRSRGDESCRFLIGSEQALGRVHAEMQPAGDFRSAVERLI